VNGYRYKEELYSNPLSGPESIKGWRLEGDGAISFPMSRLRLEGTRDPEEGQKANIVFWCPEHFPDNISISWDFYPVREPGLCILFFAAAGKNGEDLFDPSLAQRHGPYDQYHHGDINALHISYFRRKHPDERAFTTCNMRKSYGFHLVAQGADPIPSVPDAQPPYRIEIIKDGAEVRFGIGQKDKEMLTLFHCTDDGESTGPILTDGRIGFRQMTPMIGEYANLSVKKAEKEQA
jgi:hypothetical protein